MFRFGIIKGNEQYMILANVYEVENLQTEPFEGRIFLQSQMKVALHYSLLEKVLTYQN